MDYLFLSYYMFLTSLLLISAFVTYVYYQKINTSLQRQRSLYNKMSSEKEDRDIAYQEISHVVKENEEKLELLQGKQQDIVRLSSQAQTYLFSLKEKLISYYYFLIDIRAIVIRIDEINSGLENSKDVPDELWEDTVIFCENTIETMDSEIEIINEQFRKIFKMDIEDYLDKEQDSNDKSPLRELFPWLNQNLN